MFSQCLEYLIFELSNPNGFLPFNLFKHKTKLFSVTQQMTQTMFGT